MKIGIISSGIDTLTLFKFLTRYDNDYLVYCDQTNFPYGEKSLDCVLDIIQKAGEFLTKKGAEIIIVDPIYELAVKYSNRKTNFKILPLFEKYVHEYVFKNSLVGKIGIMGDFGSNGIIQDLFKKEEKSYNPTDEQTSIKKFSYPFHYWVKPAGSWVFNVNDLGVHNPYVIRSMKNDLRYFKDAYVDTFLPMQYHYFSMQRSIKSFFNFHKIRFHDLSVLEECFNYLIKEPNGKYGVAVWINQPLQFLTRNKQLMWLMQRGKSEKVEIEEI